MPTSSSGSSRTRDLLSPELGDPANYTQYNKKTGRPIRKSAGKTTKRADYVDISVAIQDEDGDISSEDEPQDDDQDDMIPRTFADKSKRKRKRSPSPPLPPIEPQFHDVELDALTEDELEGEVGRRIAKNPPLKLTFNVPLGFHGPLFVHLDSSMLRLDQADKLHEMQPAKTRAMMTPSNDNQQSVAEDTKKGFGHLPSEIRNKIYRLLFTSKEEASLRIPPATHGAGLSRSAQFLRTCKLVHSEGCSILYGENNIHLARYYGNRGAFWEHDAKEVGYQDVLQFLRVIGPENLQYLRDITLTLDDAMPRNTPYLQSQEDRRFSRDEYLLHCLRILRNGKVRRLSLRFYGRRTLARSDIKFLGYLKQIKTDELVKGCRPGLHTFDCKVNADVWKDLETTMTRKKKLYDKKSPGNRPA